MKRRLPRLTALLTVATLCIVALTGCDGDDYWYSDPPYGWDTVDDPRLDGYWMLVQYNSEPVSSLLVPGVGERRVALPDQHPV